MAKKIKYYSTNLKTPLTEFREALLKGLAPDKGLFMPETIPSVRQETIDLFSDMSYSEIAYHVTNMFLQDQIPDEVLQDLCNDAYDYDVPLEKVRNRQYILRLDQGPTASFKDFAARMMARLMNYYLGIDNQKLVILTATSGDTGSAIANAYYGLDNIDIVVLFPEAEVTPRQRKQMTTLGGNVSIIAIDGKFDDCQALVKQAFSDPDLAHIPLSSANSINIGRLIPQTVYYFYAYSRLRRFSESDGVIFSIPSGNFGDMMGCVMAKQMGLNVKKLVIATNENDEFPKMLQTEKYEKIEPSINCISSAMNVGHPSNLARLVALYDGVMDEQGNITRAPDFSKMREDMFAVSITDELTKRTIIDAYNHFNVLLEPHGAVGWAGLTEFFKKYPENDNPDQLCVSLETAHPAKFPEQINELLNIDPELPMSLKGLDGKPEMIEKIDNNYEAFKSYLNSSF